MEQSIKFSNKTIGVFVITLLFIGVYFAIKALPDSECGFLHYEKVVNENGEIEYCATNSAGFIDLSKLQYPVQLIMDWDSDSKQGQLSLKLDGGHFLLPHELAYTHTKKIHLLLVDESLEDYHHLHPNLSELDQTYTFNFNPKTKGVYKAYAEVVPKRTRRQLIASSELKVGEDLRTQNFSRKTQDVQGALHFELLGVPEVLEVNKDYRFKLTVLDPSGSPAPLETIMDAKAHMVAFDSGRLGFAHMHPVEEVVDLDALENLDFYFNVPKAGWYRLFAQVQINGASVYGSFDLLVKG